MKNLTLNSGHQIPMLGLGTWKSAPGEVGRAITEAIKIGYRHFDCAWIYGNEKEIGDAFAAAFAEGLVSREEIFVTTKLWCDSHRRQHVRSAAEASLRNLQLDYLDLYLVHWPVHLKHGIGIAQSGDDFVPLAEIPIAETWQGMQDLVSAGLVKSIGVSNFSQSKLEELNSGADIVPAMNQVEGHPYLQQPDLLAYCNSTGTAVTAYAPLGSGDRPARLKSEAEPILLEDPVVVEIADGLGVSAAQVLISWAIHRGTIVIPKSVNPQRLKQNYQAGHLSLCDSDMEKLASLDRQARFITGEHWCRHPGSPYTLTDVWG